MKLKKALAMLVSIAIALSLVPMITLTTTASTAGLIYNLDTFTGKQITSDGQAVNGWSLQRMNWGGHAGSAIAIDGAVLKVTNPGTNTRGFQINQGNWANEIPDFKLVVGEDYRMIVEASAATAGKITLNADNNSAADLPKEFDLATTKTAFTIDWTHEANEHNNPQIWATVDFDVHSILIYDKAEMISAIVIGDKEFDEFIKGSTDILQGAGLNLATQVELATPTGLKISGGRAQSWHSVDLMVLKFLEEGNYTLEVGFTAPDDTEFQIVEPDNPWRELEKSDAKKKADTLTLDFSIIDDSGLKVFINDGESRVAGDRFRLRTDGTGEYTITSIVIIVPECECEAPCCPVCGDGETPHKGGTATCQEKAVCSECERVYGDFAPHAFGTAPKCDTVCATTGCDVIFGHDFEGLECRKGNCKRDGCDELYVCGLRGCELCFPDYELWFDGEVGQMMAGYVDTTLLVEGENYTIKFNATYVNAMGIRVRYSGVGSDQGWVDGNYNDGGDANKFTTEGTEIDGIPAFFRNFDNNVPEADRVQLRKSATYTVDFEFGYDLEDMNNTELIAILGLWGSDSYYLTGLALYDADGEILAGIGDLAPEEVIEIAYDFDEEQIETNIEGDVKVGVVGGEGTVWDGIKLADGETLADFNDFASLKIIINKTASADLDEEVVTSFFGALEAFLKKA
jgi:hypothetical protein